MALVVFLRGVNVGGHRTFRPTVLAKELARFDVVNLGAAGTFVVRKPISRTALRAEIARRLPFEADAMICSGADILGLVSANPFAGQPSRPDIVRFVTILARRQPPASPIPMNIPAAGEWRVKVLRWQDQFVVGMYRREMKAIGYLGRLEKAAGVPVTTRSWSTILAVAKVLSA